MLLLLVLIVVVTGNESGSMDPLLLQFLTELVIKVLQWPWVVIIEERYEEINPILVENFFQKNVSVTILTSKIDSAIRQLLRQHNMVPVLLLLSPEMENRTYLFNTCRIKWVMFMTNSTVKIVFGESTQFWQGLQVVFAVGEPGDGFVLQIPKLDITHLHEINSWHPNTGFDNLSAFGQCFVKPVRRLRIAMEKHFPFYLPGKLIYPPVGADINILDSLATALGFKYNIQRSADGSWGGRNGTKWNGMIGMLIKEDVDAALSGMTMSYERHRAVQFSIPYAFDRVTFVTRKPARRLKTWAIFWPYKLQVWIALATSVVFIASLLTWLQTRLSRNKVQRLQFLDSLLYIFQSILNQGYYNAREPRCRVLMSFWWVFCITIIAGYNGSLMSFMAHPGLTPSLDTILQLVDAVKKGQISVGTIENSADYAMFKDSEETDLRVFLENMKSDPRNLVHHDSEGLREALRRCYAYIGGWLTVQADVWDPRLFQFSKEYFQQLQYAIAFAPEFDNVDIFNKKILQLQESGLIMKWLLEQRNPYGENVDEDSNEQNKDDSDDTPMQSSLGIDDVQGAFAVLAIGLLLGIACCVAENYVKWNRRKSEAFRR